MENKSITNFVLMDVEKKKKNEKRELFVLA